MKNSPMTNKLTELVSEQEVQLMKFVDRNIILVNEYSGKLASTH